MANIAFAIDVPVRIFPFVIPPGAVQPLTAIPRARWVFQIKDSVITAKIATNTTSIVATCSLAQNFVYVLEYATVEIQVIDDPADAGNFDLVGAIAVGFGDGLGSRNDQLFSRGLQGILANAGSSQTYAPQNKFSLPIFNQNQGSPAIFIDLNDTDAGATNAALFHCVVSVLQYDFDQAFNFPLNFPLPVSQR